MSFSFLPGPTQSKENTFSYVETLGALNLVSLKRLNITAQLLESRRIYSLDYAVDLFEGFPTDRQGSLVVQSKLHYHDIPLILEAND